MTCIKPLAPFGLTALGFPLLSECMVIGIMRRNTSSTGMVGASLFITLNCFGSRA